MPFIFVTGYGTAGLPGGISSASVLTKPFSEEPFAEAIRLLLAERKPC